MGKALWISGLSRDSSYSDIWNMITFWFTYFNGDLVKVLLNSWYGWVIASNIKNEYNYISMFKSQFDHDVAKGASDILKSQSYHWRSQNEIPNVLMRYMPSIKFAFFVIHGNMWTTLIEQGWYSLASLEMLYI